MTFIALTLDVAGVDVDAWSDALLDEGALSVDAVYPRAGPALEAAVFDEHVDGEPRWWPVSRLTALLADGSDVPAIVARAARVVGQPSPEFRTAAVADQDWVRATQAQWTPIRIDDDLWIVPTWCTPPHERALNVVLDPGLAFGTGAHESTRLCLRWLRQNVAGPCSVLDYGCGSGILAITAAMLGAARVVGIDIDPQAVNASRANAQLNAVRVDFRQVDQLPMTTFDIVVANILAAPLRMLAPVLASRAAPGGSIALSGILAGQAGDVAAAYARWFQLSTSRADGDWVLLAGRRNGVDVVAAP
jgi:ribosomal protein L11 methyltransferase